MPKELTHFKIAQRTAEKLADTRFSSCLQNRPHALLLGSVLHDVTFYGVTPGCRHVRGLGDILHGAGYRDTFDPIRLQAIHAQKAKNKDLPIALLVGMISHLYADAVFHPMVWHLTGDYFAQGRQPRSEAQQRHRTLESLMDMVACPEMLGHPNYSLRLLLRRCKSLYTEGLPTGELAAIIGIQHKVLIDEMTKSWNLFALMQSMYSVRIIAGGIHACSPYLPNSIAEVAALFYAPQLMQQADILSGNVNFLHPLTGETHATTLEKMMEKAAGEAASLCRKLESSIFDGKAIDISGNGPSMDAGLSGQPAPSTAHFAVPPQPYLK